MTANSQEIVYQIYASFEVEMKKIFTINKEKVVTADMVERNLQAILRQLGLDLMATFFIQQDELIAPEKLVTPENQVLVRHGSKERCYHCIFGKIQFVRRYYYGQGIGACPLDAQLNLPKEATSDLLRDWLEHLGAFMPYQEGVNFLQEMLGRPLSSRLLQATILEDGEMAEDFYAQAESQPSDPEASILVVQADGKGIPMITDPQESVVRLGKGQKPCRKKEAIVTSIYTLAPTPRTPQSVTNSIFHPASKEKEAQRPKPYRKWLWGTLKGKKEALAFTARELKHRDQSHIHHRVALTDGCEALQTEVQTCFPDFSLVLDFIHAHEYLWKAGNALLGETSPERSSWVEARTLLMLSGKTADVIDEFRGLLGYQGTSASACKVLEAVVRYFERNLPYMRYNLYLDLGWPIATGVIEGACRHLVKDRFEQSGMRWTQVGAEALLHLRSVAVNGDWKAFHEYRCAQRQKTLHQDWERPARNSGENAPVQLKFAA